MDNFFDVANVMRKNLHSAGAAAGKAHQKAVNSIARPIRSAVKSTDEAAEKTTTTLMAELQKAEALIQEAQDQSGMLPMNPVARRRSSISPSSSSKSPFSPGKSPQKKQQQPGDHFASGFTSMGSDESISRIGSSGSFGRTNSFGRTASGNTYDEDVETVLARFGTFVRCLEATGGDKGGDEGRGRQKEADMDTAARWLVPAKLRKQAPPKLMTVHKIVTPLKIKGDRTLLPDVAAEPAGDTEGRKSWFDAVAGVLGVGKDGMQEKEEDHGNEEWLERVSREIAESMQAAEEKSKEVIHAAEEKSKGMFQPVLEGSAHVNDWVDENITRPATETVGRFEGVVKENVVNVWVDENLTRPATETVVKVEGAVKEGVKEVEEKGVGVWVDEHITKPATETVKEGVKEVGDKGVGVWIDEMVGKPLKEGYENMEGKGREIVQTVEEKSKEIVEKGKDFVQNAEERSREIVQTVQERSKEIVDKGKDAVHDLEERSREIIQTVEEKRVEIATGVDEIGRDINEKGVTPVVTELVRRTRSGTIERAPAIVQGIEAEFVRARNAAEETFPEQVHGVEDFVRGVQGKEEEAVEEIKRGGEAVYAAVESASPECVHWVQDTAGNIQAKAPEVAKEVMEKLGGGGVYVMQSVEDGVVQIKHKGDEIAEGIETVGVAKTVEHEKEELVHVIEEKMHVTKELVHVIEEKMHVIKEKERETERLVRDRTAEVVEVVREWGGIGAFGAVVDGAEDAGGRSVGGDGGAGGGVGEARVEAWLASVDVVEGGKREGLGSGRAAAWLPGAQLEKHGHAEVGKEVAALVDKVSDEAGHLVYGAGRLLGGMVARVKVAVRGGEEGLSGGARGAGEAGGALFRQIGEVVKTVAEVPMDVARGVGGGIRALPLAGHEKHQEVIRGGQGAGNVVPIPDGPKLYRAITPKEGGGVADGADPETWDWGELEGGGTTYKVAG